MDEKQLKFLLRLNDFFEKGAVHPEDLIKFSEALLKVINTTRADLTKLLDTRDEQDVENFKALGEELDKREKTLTDLIAECKKQNSEDVDKAKESFKKSMDEAVAKFPKIPNLKDVYDAIEKVRKAIPTLPDLDIEIYRRGEAVRNSLELLLGDERLDVSAIRGLEELLEKLRKEFAGYKGRTISGGMTRTLVQQMIDAASLGGGGGGFTYINEVVAGSGTSFTLDHTPVDSSRVALYGGGSRLTPTADYTIAGAAITMAFAYSAGQVLADYS